MSSEESYLTFNEELLYGRVRSITVLISHKVVSYKTELLFTIFHLRSSLSIIHRPHPRPRRVSYAALVIVSQVFFFNFLST